MPGASVLANQFPQNLTGGSKLSVSLGSGNEAGFAIGAANRLINRRVEGGIMANAARNVETAKPAPVSEPGESESVWDKIAGSKEFLDLMATKKVFIVPAFIFFVVYYFALPVLVGYAPQFMATKVIGQVNLAYLFALSQFFVAWLIAGLYVKAANNFDRLAKDILDKNGKGGK